MRLNPCWNHFKDTVKVNRFLCLLKKVNDQGCLNPQMTARGSGTALRLCESHRWQRQKELIYLRLIIHDEAAAVIVGKYQMKPRTLKEIVAGESFNWGDDQNEKYFEVAEERIDIQWDSLIKPFIYQVDFCHGRALDLAAGKGRNTRKLCGLFDQVIAVDVHPENLAFLEKRFGEDPKVEVVATNGFSLERIGSASIDLVYCFDSMVHFDLELIISYMKELYRVMKTGSYGFVHHSNYTQSPGRHFLQNPHARNFMSNNLFAHICMSNGFSIIKQQYVDWPLLNPEFKQLDGLTLFAKF